MFNYTSCVCVLFIGLRLLSLQCPSLCPLLFSTTVLCLEIDPSSKFVMRKIHDTVLVTVYDVVDTCTCILVNVSARGHQKQLDFVGLMEVHDDVCTMGNLQCMCVSLFLSLSLLSLHPLSRQHFVTYQIDIYDTVLYITQGFIHNITSPPTHNPSAHTTVFLSLIHI